MELSGSLLWGIDGNVREAVEADRKSDSFLRILTELSSGPLRKGDFAGIGGMRVLLDRYNRYGSESRDQLEGNVDIQRRLHNSIAVWASGRAEFRSYPDSLRRNYQRGTYALGIRAPFRGGSITFGGSGRGIDFNDTPGFDCHSRAFTVSYWHTLARDMEFTGTAEFESSRWARPAYDVSGPKSVHQKDQGRQGLASVRYLHGWLLDVTLGWESVRSNSYGYSLGRKSVEGGVSGWLPGAVLLQIRGRKEWVSYRDHDLDLLFWIPQNVNVEANEDNNSILMRLRRSLTRELAIEGRASWFRNESPFVGLYYRKAVGSFGLVWTPIGTSEF